jgi:hypothetical protein
MSDKICPIMTRKNPQHDSEYGMSSYHYCEGDKCQWWWKCKKPDGIERTGINTFTGKLTMEGQNE